MAYARSVVNQIWILKNSKELFKNLKSQGFSQIDSISPHFIQQLITID
jgi:hypothetical protein